ncbi:MAG: hypothetical protein ACKOPS_27170, partial [Cyanobium sp.]
SAVRSRYLQQVAERLSGGQARLALQLEDDLRQQVKGQRWHGRSTSSGQRWFTGANGPDPGAGPGSAQP